jgi:hypothetical protein
MVVATGTVFAMTTAAQAAISNVEVREITGTWTVGPGVTGSNGLVCAAGETVLQGGVLSMTLSNRVYVLSSYASSFDKWSWVVYNDTSSNQEIHARAICATGFDNWEARGIAETVPAGGSKFISAACPPGKVAISGGWKVGRDRGKVGDWFVSASQPITLPTSSWRIHVTNDSSEALAAYSVQAICSSQTGSTLSTSSVTVNPGQTAAKAVNCGSNAWLVGGGFKNIASGLNIVTAAIPTAGSPDTWKINVRNPDTVAHTVGMYNTCLPK